ncbi:sigma-54-dependent transcriptional regulator [Saccharophagus degradans]|uniref:Sigma-54 factor, interaction region n=1 Tax=Saccharophagus degradans (strain 2-40 / ATCC 43961 / DSM 17024) TaxID=203122 RepID=Q21IM8_SACD2|nr:sigma-54 dependent transcriptional regulator [Saccharophagus degradans]ABD81451.1 sigma-54 factor, interaction region [Saccharophagus degradans 2-40]
MTNPAQSTGQLLSEEYAREIKIMVVEDDLDLREAVVDTLDLAGFSVVQAASAEQALELLEASPDQDLIISDVNMGAMSGHDLLRKVRTDYPQIPVVLVTAYASINDSVVAMKEGAVDYLVKPFETQVLIDTVKKVVGGNTSASDEPIANAPGSRQLLQLACRVAQSDSTVLVIGESGTGKEVLARYIHTKSKRADMPFVAINCAAIPENMLEAMLFGHEKGAYTGAYSSAPGKFEQANGGTLLLDEISEMDIGLQAKLLRVLQEREVERLGGRKSIKLDVRVIATSNRDMRREVANGKFREDLYFRLSVLPLQWAPLRDRREDIVPLAESLLSRHAAKQHRQGVQLSDDTKHTLETYPWPGNVRELDNVMQRALILQPGNIIHSPDLGLQTETLYSDKPSLVDDIATYSQNAIAAIAQPRAVEVAPKELDIPEPEGAVLGHDLRKREFEIIVQTLRDERGSKKNTAKKLGISPRTLRYKLARLKEEGYDLQQALSYS